MSPLLYPRNLWISLWVGTGEHHQVTEGRRISMYCTRIRQCLLMLLLAGCVTSSAMAELHTPFEVTGSVFRNPDGDTIWLDTAERGKLNIRLSGADTPETGQAYWKAARGYLRSLVARQKVMAWCYKRDRYEREVCHVRIGNRDLGEALIAEGYAWYVDGEYRSSGYVSRGSCWRGMHSLPGWQLRPPP